MRTISKIMSLVFFCITIANQTGCQVASEPKHNVNDSVKLSQAELDAEYKKAISQASLSSYGLFIKKYPYSSKIEEIKKLRNALDTCKPDKSFKMLQLRNDNPKMAYQRKESVVKKLLEAKNVDYQTLEVFFRVIKNEEIMEVWAKDRCGNDTFSLIKTYPLCVTKNRDGLRGVNLLVPESFYYIAKYHPAEPYFVRMEINFPNSSDKIRGRTGGDIAIHGGCFSTYCTPFTDDDIMEIYIFALEAKAKGQSMVPVHNFPARMDNVNFEKLISNPKYASDEKRIALWTNMKVGYDYFEKYHRLPVITHDSKGVYLYNQK